MNERPETTAPATDLPPSAYPAGAVLALLGTDLVTAPTRAVLHARLQRPAVVAPRCFDSAAYAILTAACARLILQPPDRPAIDIPGAIDNQLADGAGNGWRYDALPPDAEAHRLGLNGIEHSAQVLFGGGFATLAPAQQDAVLHAVQAGEVGGGPWETVPPIRYFQKLLVAATTACYAHPLAQEDIGYVGMADAHGWHAIGLDRLDPHEPRRRALRG